MRGLIIVQKRFVRMSTRLFFCFAKLWECVRVLASLLTQRLCIDKRLLVR